MPRRTKTEINLDSSAMTTRSQAKARCMPPPAAVPLTPAITGFSQSMIDCTSRPHPVRMTRAASPTMRSGEHHGPHPRVTRRLDHPVADRVAHRRGHGVSGVGPVQRDPEDAVLDAPKKVVAHLVAHLATARASRATA